MNPFKSRPAQNGYLVEILFQPINPVLSAQQELALLKAEHFLYLGVEEVGPSIVVRQSFQGRAVK